MSLTKKNRDGETENTEETKKFYKPRQCTVELTLSRHRFSYVNMLYSEIVGDINTVKYECVQVSK